MEDDHISIDIKLETVLKEANQVMSYDQIFNFIKEMLEFDLDYNLNFSVFEYLAKYFMNFSGSYLDGEHHSEEFLELLDKIAKYKKKLEIALVNEVKP